MNGDRGQVLTGQCRPESGSDGVRMAEKPSIIKIPHFYTSSRDRKLDSVVWQAGRQAGKQAGRQEGKQRDTNKQQFIKTSN